MQDCIIILSYDDTKIYLKLFEGYDGVWFEEVNDYSVVLAKLLLRKTALKIYFGDERIRWFVDDHKNLRVCARHPDGRIMVVNGEYERLNYELIFDNTWYVSLFHNVFVLQWVTDLPLEQVKYADLALNPGDTIFVYTDGVPEATDRQDALFGTERMLEALNRRKEAPLEELLQGLRQDIETFADGAAQFDDITMLGFRYRGEESHAAHRIEVEADGGEKIEAWQSS